MWDELVCPFDQGCFANYGEWLSCRRCGRGAPIIDGIPRFLPEEDQPHWRETQKLRVMEIGAIRDSTSKDCAIDRSTALRRSARQVERRLQNTIRLTPQSRVVQIGVPGEGIIHHLRAGMCYAVDPLAGEMANRETLRYGRVRWIAARGEGLPFADSSVELVILDQTLADMESPQRVLDEAARCVKSNGAVLMACPLEPSATLSLLHAIASGLRRAARLVRGRGTLHSFTARSLVRMTRRAGLRRRKSWWGKQTGGSMFHLDRGGLLAGFRGGFGVLLAQPTARTIVGIRRGRGTARVAGNGPLETRAA